MKNSQSSFREGPFQSSHVIAMVYQYHALSYRYTENRLYLHLCDTIFAYDILLTRLEDFSPNGLADVAIFLYIMFSMPKVFVHFADVIQLWSPVTLNFVWVWYALWNWFRPSLSLVFHPLTVTTQSPPTHSLTQGILVAGRYRTHQRTQRVTDLWSLWIIVFNHCNPLCNLIFFYDMWHNVCNKVSMMVAGEWCL